MAIKSLGYIGISSQQTGAWREFACGVMGLEDVSARCNAQQDEAYFKMDDHPYRLFVSPGDTESLQVCGWETNSAEGLQEVADALSQAGVDFTWGDSALIARRRVQNLLCFQDPSGNCHEAFWGVVSDFRKFNSAAGVQHFVTGEQGMGHVVLPAPNFDETVAFLSDVLGFGLSDLMKLRFTPDPDEPVTRLWFMHCNQRHHSLGLFEMPMPAGCVHMMLEVNDVDEVGRCNDRRIAADVKLTGTLGRHANDHMVSFYMRSPSGFDVEIGAEGRIVDDWSAYQVFESTVPSFWGHDFSVGQVD
jgi:3,4-dihydroxy-9,10-secoandrosta-1,3,5(10)-triene-9,17-dione 4,5-dioxygenase